MRHCNAFPFLGIDSNMCCGTHVKNLSDIQVRVARYYVIDIELLAYMYT